MINYLLGMFVTSTILLIIFIIKYCVVIKKEKEEEEDFEKLSKIDPDQGIEKSEFFR
jgi:hypothetical protein